MKNKLIEDLILSRQSNDIIKCSFKYPEKELESKNSKTVSITNLAEIKNKTFSNQLGIRRPEHILLLKSRIDLNTSLTKFGTVPEDFFTILSASEKRMNIIRPFRKNLEEDRGYISETKLKNLFKTNRITTFRISKNLNWSLISFYHNILKLFIHPCYMNKNSAIQSSKEEDRIEYAKYLNYIFSDYRLNAIYSSYKLSKPFGVFLHEKNKIGAMKTVDIDSPPRIIEKKKEKKTVEEEQLIQLINLSTLISN